MYLYLSVQIYMSVNKFINIHIFFTITQKISQSLKTNNPKTALTMLDRELRKHIKKYILYYKSFWHLKQRKKPRTGKKHNLKSVQIMGVVIYKKKRKKKEISQKNKKDFLYLWYANIKKGSLNSSFKSYRYKDSEIIRKIIKSTGYKSWNKERMSGSTKKEQSLIGWSDEMEKQSSWRQ